MHMTFFWTPDLEEFFFNGLKIKSIEAMVFSCLVLALFSILYEGIKVYSSFARARKAREQIAAVSCAVNESANLLVTDTNSNSLSKRFCRLINETIVFVFHNTLGYVLMLAVMAYSGWMFLAVVLSMGLGYFFFGHIAMRVNMESIHARTVKVICAPACQQECAEAGASGNAKRIAPCPSAPQLLNGSETDSSKACHENQTMRETEHEKSQTTTATNEESTDESCSCRL